MKRNRMILSHQSFLVYRIHTNTYMNIGLPPGPIVPDITALEAVLDPEK
jgi:cell division protein YceG involved in septum cleavage